MAVQPFILKALGGAVASPHTGSADHLGRSAHLGQDNDHPSASRQTADDTRTTDAAVHGPEQRGVMESVAKANSAPDLKACSPNLVEKNKDMPAIAELRAHRQWVAWRYKELETTDGSTKLTKPPVNPMTGGGASHSKPETWGMFEQALAFTNTRKLPGVGFVLSEDDDYTGIDLDKCRDVKTGVVEPWAQAIIDFNETYTEVSPSGTGIRMIARGKIDAAVKVDAAHVEMYGKQRYLTITADHIPGSPTEIGAAPKTIEALRARAAEFQAKAASPPAEPRTPRPAAAPPVDMFGSRKAGDPLSEQAKKYIEKNAGTARTRASSGSAEPKSSFFRKVNDTALDQLDDWFPVVFPAAKKQPGTGGWRVESKDLGRNLEEAISAIPGKSGGITDYGVADMGDAQGGARTAISLVMEWVGAPDAVQAAFWLCEQIGVSPESMGWRDRTTNDEPANDDHATTGSDGTQSTGQTGDTSDAPDPLAGFTFHGDAPQSPSPKLVKGLLGKQEIAFIGGQSGAGKTFIAIELAVCLAGGASFFGRKVVERVGVAILAGEGGGTILNRVEVAHQHKSGGPSLPIAWLGTVPDLMNPREMAALIERLKEVNKEFKAKHGVRLGVIILDTLAATFALEDENSNSEATKAIRQMKILSDSLGVTVVPVHHFGKAKETGLRGASAFRAGCDTVLTVLADRNQQTGECKNRSIALAKSRDGEEGWTVPFTLRGVTLGQDEDGEDYGTCFVEPGMDEHTGRDGSAAEGTAPRGRLSEHAKSYLDALNAVLDKGKKIRPWGAEGAEVFAVDREIVRKEFYPRCMAEGDEKAKQDTRKKAFQRGEAGAKKAGVVATMEVNGTQYVWLLREDQPNPHP